MKWQALVAIGTLTGFGTIALLAAGQTPQKTRFEVVAIRPAPALNGEQFASLRFLPGGRFEADTSIHGLIAAAFGPETSSLPNYQIIGLPSRLAAMRFRVSAKPSDDTPGDLPRPAVLLMLQALMEDRFKLAWHKETRMLPAYALTSRSNSRLGPGLRRSTADCEARKQHPTADAPACGFRLEPGRLTVIGEPMSVVATLMRTTGSFIRSGLPHPVFDRTNLVGLYDADMEWDPLAENAIMTLAQEQLGLRFGLGQEPTEVVVIDHIEPPTPD